MLDQMHNHIRRFWLEKVVRCPHTSDAQKKKLINAIDFILVGPSYDDLEALPNAKICSVGEFKIELRFEGKLWPPTVTLIVEFKGDAATIADIEGLQKAKQ